MLPADRTCHPRASDNPLRRRFAPASRELDRLGVAEGQSVADLGAGVGFFAPELLRRVGPEGRLYLVDPDLRNLARAGERVGRDPRDSLLRTSAARVTEIPERSVDRVLLSLVLCCMSDKEGALDEAWRILRPGGRVYASYPRHRFAPRRRWSSLRVTPERWRTLLRIHPWREVSIPSSWAVVRHLLERPP